ncbi:MAG: PorT family protein [Dysgonamonadaceae bacterium]|jgi:hypothetical protein|nr:PorT family protein [Dysgonamonadaceae bacterium]
MNNENSFDEVVREKLKDYTLLPDKDCWKTIENRLNEKHEKKIRWLWISGTAAAIAIILIGLIFTFNNKKYLYETAEQLPGHEERIKENVLEKETIPNVISSNNKKTYKTSKGEIIGCSNPPESKHKVTIVESERYPNLQKLLESQTSEEEEKSPIRTSKKSKSLSIHVGSGALLAMNNNVKNNAYSDLRSGEISMNSPDYLKKSMLTTDDFTDITHYAPLSFGLTFKKELNDRFAIESGLVYTFLASKFENKNPKRDAILQLHYLGVPLNLHVKLYGNPYSKWNFYLSAGFMLEKGLLSHYSQNEYHRNGTKLNLYSNERIDGMQSSLNLSLGVEYRIAGNYSVYFEPELSHYLENNQPISARTEIPMILGINAGIRWIWKK